MKLDVTQGLDALTTWIELSQCVLIYVWLICSLKCIYGGLANVVDTYIVGVDLVWYDTVYVWNSLSFVVTPFPLNINVSRLVET